MPTPLHRTFQMDLQTVLQLVSLEPALRFSHLTLNRAGLNAEINSGHFYNLYSGFVMLMIIHGRQHHIIGN